MLRANRVDFRKVTFLKLIDDSREKHKGNQHCIVVLIPAFNFSLNTSPFEKQFYKLKSVKLVIFQVVVRSSDY